MLLVQVLLPRTTIVHGVYDGMELIDGLSMSVVSLVSSYTTNTKTYHLDVDYRICISINNSAKRPGPTSNWMNPLVAGGKHDTPDSLTLGPL